MRKHILIVAAIIITGMAVVGCGSKQETSASAGELTRETTIEEETTTIKTGKKPQKQTESSVKETETTKGKEITETTEEKTTQKENPTVQEPTTSAKSQPEASTQVQTQTPQPQPEVPTPAPEPVTEAPAPAPEAPTEAPTQAPQPQPEVPTPAPEPVTEAPTQPQKTQAEYLEEFKQNYLALRKEKCGDAPQWNDTLYKIAKLRADELDSYFDHYSPNGYRSGYNTMECISSSPGYTTSWKMWNQSSDHYMTLINYTMDMYAVAVGEGGCVFLTASSRDWTGEAYADIETEKKKQELKDYAINKCGATEDNWKDILENEVLWRICKDENGNERFDITWDIAIDEYWQSRYDWYTQHYGEKVIR